MQTVVLDVQDSFLQDFLEIVKGLKDKVKLQNKNMQNLTTLQALKECEDIEKNPSSAKTYNDVDKMFADILDD